MSMDNPLDLRRIRHLRAAITEGSMSSAAKRLGLSQPALSASIKSLEMDLGVSLLERHRFGVTATEQADELVAHVQRIENELDAAWQRLTLHKGRESTSLCIGCGPSEATRLLPAALSLLRAARPQLRILVEYGLNETLMPMVRRGDITLALSSIPQSVTYPELHHETLHLDHAVVVARVGHPLEARRNLSANDLAAYPWVLAGRWELERKALDELFGRAGIHPVDPMIETTSAILMKTVLMHSDFLTFVPRDMIYWEERADLLRPLKGVQSSWERHVGITTRHGEDLPEPGRLLIVSLRKAARGLIRR